MTWLNFSLTNDLMFCFAIQGSGGIIWAATTIAIGDTFFWKKHCLWTNQNPVAKISYHSWFVVVSVYHSWLLSWLCSRKKQARQGPNCCWQRTQSPWVTIKWCNGNFGGGRETKRFMQMRKWNRNIGNKWAAAGSACFLYIGNLVSDAIKLQLLPVWEGGALEWHFLLAQSCGSICCRSANNLSSQVGATMFRPMFSGKNEYFIRLQSLWTCNLKKRPRCSSFDQYSHCASQPASS